MADYALEPYVEEMNRAAASIAREAADAATSAATRASRASSPARSARPTGPRRISPDVNDPGARNVTWDELVDAYVEAARGLVDGGADILLIETIFDTLNGKAAIFAVETLFDELGFRLPVIVSGTITDQSRPDAVAARRSGPSGTACATRDRSPSGSTARSAREMLRPYVAELARIADVPVITYPNAGLPNAFGGYDEQPPETSGVLGQLAREGALNLVGGCCGTTPDHTRAIAAAVEGLAPRDDPDARAAGRACPAWSRSTSGPIRCSSTSASGPTSPARAPSRG